MLSMPYSSHGSDYRGGGEYLLETRRASDNFDACQIVPCKALQAPKRGRWLTPLKSWSRCWCRLCCVKCGWRGGDCLRAFCIDTSTRKLFLRWENLHLRGVFTELSSWIHGDVKVNSILSSLLFSVFIVRIYFVFTAVVTLFKLFTPGHHLLCHLLFFFPFSNHWDFH